MRRALGILAIVFVGLQMLFLLGVLFGEAIPDARVADALVEAVDSGQLTEEDYAVTRLGNRLDGFTDCVALTMGLGDPQDSNPAETALTSPTLWRCEFAVPAISQYQVDGGLDAHREYFLYWHGYAAVTRPILAVAGVEGVRFVLMGLLLASAATLTVVIGRSLGWLAPALLLGPLILTTDFAELHLEIPNALSMAVALGGGAAAWLAIDRYRSMLGVAIAGLISGSLYVYFDLLTNPPLAWLAAGGLAMVAAYWVGWDRTRTALVGAASLAAWMAGYAGTWLVKWLLAALVLGVGGVRDRVREQVEFRLQGESEHVDDSFGAAIDRNFDEWFAHPVMTGWLFALGLLALGAGVFVVWRWGGGSGLKWMGLLAIPALIPIVWYELLSNHSQIHAFFTYRALPFAFGYLLLVVYAGLRTTHLSAGTHRFGGYLPDHRSSARRRSDSTATSERSTTS